MQKINEMKSYLLIKSIRLLGAFALQNRGGLQPLQQFATGEPQVLEGETRVQRESQAGTGNERLRTERDQG